jgi:hypothetical protein
MSGTCTVSVHCPRSVVRALFVAPIACTQCVCVFGSGMSNICVRVCEMP